MMGQTWNRSARAAGGARANRRVPWIMVGLALLAITIPNPSWAVVAVRASVSTGGGQGDDVSTSPAIGADGQFVAFASLASDLVPGDNNDAWDVFVHNLQTGETERVSVTSDGEEGDGDSILPAISADGRYVAFVSSATNLVAGDTNGVADIFLHDRDTGETTRVSVATDGTEADGASTTPSICANGRYVAFASDASTLVLNDTNGAEDVFVHDRLTAHTERVSVTSDGTQTAGDIGGVAISGDGHCVAFASTAPDLVADDTNGVSDIFVNNRQTGETDLISVATDGTLADDASLFPSINADGRFVAFASAATNLVDGDTNGIVDIFVRDRVAGETERVSVTSDGAEAAGASGDPSLSSDGRYLSFWSAGINLVPGDSNGCVDVFVHDRQTGRTERASLAPDGGQANGDSGLSSLATDGRYVAFASAASNLVTGDTNLVQDIFVCERPVADFSADVRNGLIPLTVTFTDLSTGEPTSWAWDFGDGTSAVAPNPSHVYDAEGSYTVSLTVANVYGSDTTVRPDYITVSSPVPHADFSGEPRSGLAPLLVAFTDLSTNSPTLWVWAFGDGGTSTQQNPSHTYTSNGVYTVALLVNNAWGFDIEIKDDYIVVAPVPPLAQFSGTPTSGTAPLLVAFTDLSLNNPDSWLWEFGDGGTSAAQHPSHQYNSAGTFTVSLTVENSVGSDIETKPDYITVAAPPPLIANFTATPTIGFAPLNVAFTDASTNNPIAWAWDFGDGATSTAQNPTHQYGAVGTYAVTLTATNAAGSDVETKAHYILVTFPDVPFDPEYGALHEILACVDAGVVQGYPDGNYRPERVVNRGNMAIYIARAIAGGEDGVQMPSGVMQPTFPDVDETSPVYKYVEYCAAENVVEGYWDGRYHPERDVSRGQMAIYVSRAMVAPSGDEGVPNPPAGQQTFPDVAPDNDYVWCYKHVEFLADADVVQGYGDGLYHPERTVVRGQMAIYIQRAFDLPM